MVESKRKINLIFDQIYSDVNQIDNKKICNTIYSQDNKLNTNYLSSENLLLNTSTHLSLNSIIKIKSVDFDLKSLNSIIEVKSESTDIISMSDLIYLPDNKSDINSLYDAELASSILPKIESHSIIEDNVQSTIVKLLTFSDYYSISYQSNIIINNNSINKSNYYINKYNVSYFKSITTINNLLYNDYKFILDIFPFLHCMVRDEYSFHIDNLNYKMNFIPNMHLVNNNLFYDILIITTLIKNFESTKNKIYLLIAMIDHIFMNFLIISDKSDFINVLKYQITKLLQHTNLINNILSCHKQNIKIVDLWNTVLENII